MILTKSPSKYFPWKNIISCAITHPIRTAYTIGPDVSKSFGPTTSPCIVNAPNKVAATTSPGIPSVSNGIKVAAVAPLFADSGAAIPLISPSPNFSPGLAFLFASL